MTEIRRRPARVYGMPPRVPLPPGLGLASQAPTPVSAGVSNGPDDCVRLPPETTRKSLNCRRRPIAAIEAVQAVRDGSATLSGRQTRRSALRAAQHNALRAMAASAPKHTWAAAAICWSFYFRLRSRAATSPSATARRHANAQRARAIELRSSAPRPLIHFDVCNSADGLLCYRSDRATVSASHPAERPDPLVKIGFLIMHDGSTAPPLFPPSQSDLVLCADASGAMCYYNTALGDAQWDAPEGSTSEAGWILAELSAPFPDPPPCLPPKLSLNSLRNTGWYPLFRDADNCIQLYHSETGTVRYAPWIALRTDSGIVFFVNLVTMVSRWMPPHRWADLWISRPGYAQG